jgi:hypothetical protein
MTNDNKPMRPLLPHQQALVDGFFNNPTERGFVAQWDVGLGSVWTIAHIIKNFIAANLSSRVLVLSPKVLTEQTHYHLAAIGLQADLVDRFRFRAMEDQESSSTPIWRNGGIYVLGTDFAKQDDIATSLGAVEWDLLIVPEAQQIRGQKERFVKKLVESSPAIRVLLLTLPGVDNLPNLGIEQWNKTTVRHSEVVDATGRRIFDLPAPILRSAEYRLDAAECRLQDAVAEVVKLLGQGGTISELLGSSIENSMRSSVSALEGVIHRLRNRLTHETFDAFPEVNQLNEETDADDLPILVHATDNRPVLTALERCLAELESISGDSKLKGLTHLLMESQKRESSPRTTCIHTKYRATLSYIQTALDELGFATFALHGSLNVSERFKVLDEFQNHGGILIATTAVMEGLNMPKVESLIMYDLPKSRLILQQILGRFQRYGRSVPLKIDVINGQDGIELLSEVILESVGGGNLEAIRTNK